MDDLLLDVEKEQQVEQLLQALHELLRRMPGELLVAQAVEVMLETREVGEVLAHLERLHGKRQRVRAMRLEFAEVRTPRIELARCKQDFAEVLVRCRVLRILAEHLPVGGRGGARIGLFLEEHAEIEVRRHEIRLERERALVGAGRIR